MSSAPVSLRFGKETSKFRWGWGHGDEPRARRLRRAHAEPLPPVLGSARRGVRRPRAGHCRALHRPARASALPLRRTAAERPVDRGVVRRRRARPRPRRRRPARPARRGRGVPGLRDRPPSAVPDRRAARRLVGRPGRDSAVPRQGGAQGAPAVGPRRPSRQRHVRGLVGRRRARGPRRARARPLRAQAQRRVREPRDLLRRRVHVTRQCRRLRRGGQRSGAPRGVRGRHRVLRQRPGRRARRGPRVLRQPVRAGRPPRTPGRLHRRLHRAHRPARVRGGGRLRARGDGGHGARAQPLPPRAQDRRPRAVPPRGRGSVLRRERRVPRRRRPRRARRLRDRGPPHGVGRALRRVPARLDDLRRIGARARLRHQRQRRARARGVGGPRGRVAPGVRALGGRAGGGHACRALGRSAASALVRHHDDADRGRLPPDRGADALAGADQPADDTHAHAGPDGRGLRPAGGPGGARPAPRNAAPGADRARAARTSGEVRPGRRGAARRAPSPRLARMRSAPWRPPTGPR